MAPRFEGFERVEEVGRGGFGVVYRAWQPEFRRTVALKLVGNRGLSADAMQRFQREAAAMGTLSGHPNIVVVHGSGVTADGEPFLVMPFFRAGSLGDRIHVHGPVAWADAITMGVKLAGALASAHGSGVLHLDVKPDNVLFSDFGEPQLADFGMSRLEGLADVDGGGKITATPLFAAPEVLWGEEPTAAADVYSLGATLYAAIQGRPAFFETGDEHLATVLSRVATQAPEQPEHDLPESVWEVLQWAMAKSADDRCGSATALGRALQETQRDLGVDVTTITLPAIEGEVMAGRGTPTRTIDLSRPPSREPSRTPTEPPRAPAGDGTSGPPPRRRLPRALILGGAAVLAVVVGIAGVQLLTPDDEPPAVAPDIDPADVEPGDLANPAAARDGDRPTGFSVTRADDDHVLLTWTNTAEDADGVVIQSEDEVEQVDAPNVTQATARVTAEARTCFLVGSITDLEVSWVDEQVCATTTPPSSPADFSVEAQGTDEVVMRWSDTSTNEEGFTVRNVANGEVVGDVGIDGTTFTLRDVDPQVLQCFVVVAENDRGTAESEQDCVGS